MALPSDESDPLQLSLFDEAPTAIDGRQAAPPTQRNRQTPPDSAPQPMPHHAATSPAPSKPEARFHHPRATRKILLGEHVVGYEFRRAKRRSIGFVIATEGLSVSAPRWVAVSEVEQALQAKASWILRKLHQQREQADRLQAARIDWRDGTSLPFLGETVILLLDSRVTGAQLNAEAEGLPGVPRMVLHVGLPQTATQEQIREAVQSWLQRQARRIFEQRCEHFAAALGVQVRRLSLSSAATRWGSASADGSVRLNWRLVHFAMPVIDYVVTHELAHLREMNHSSAFWDVVRSVLPDYEHSRGVLRTEVLPSMD